MDEMKTPPEEVEGRFTLASIGGGAAEEKFAIALKEVLANIKDVNTPCQKDRVITLKVTISPEKSRKTATYGIVCSTKLQPAAAFSGDLYLDHTNSLAFEDNPDQEKISFDNVKPLNKGS